jgi:hypothetical protein
MRRFRSIWQHTGKPAASRGATAAFGLRDCEGLCFGNCRFSPFPSRDRQGVGSGRHRGGWHPKGCSAPYRALRLFVAAGKKPRSSSAPNVDRQRNARRTSSRSPAMARACTEMSGEPCTATTTGGELQKPTPLRSWFGYTPCCSMCYVHFRAATVRESAPGAIAEVIWHPKVVRRLTARAGYS